MADDPAGFGRAAQDLRVPEDQEDRFRAAVHEAVQRRIAAIMRTRGRRALADELRDCSECGRRVILLDDPSTFTVESGRFLCAACKAEHELVAILHPPADIGGEG